MARFFRAKVELLEKDIPKILKENGSGGCKPLKNAQGD
jgi:hypothetical protein